MLSLGGLGYRSLFLSSLRHSTLAFVAPHHHCAPTLTLRLARPSQSRRNPKETLLKPPFRSSFHRTLVAQKKNLRPTAPALCVSIYTDYIARNLDLTYVYKLYIYINTSTLDFCVPPQASRPTYPSILLHYLLNFACT